MFRSLTLDDIDPNWQASGRWRRGQALGTPGGMTVPVSRIFVHHTVSADTGDVVADVSGPCDTDQRNFGKVSYSWNIHESTNSVIEVEGTCRGAHTINNKRQSLNGISFGFGVIGNFHPTAPNPPPRQPSDALLQLIADAIIEKAVKPGYTVPGFTIEGHRDAPFATACCGDWLYAKLPIIRALVSSPPPPPSTDQENDMPTPVVRRLVINPSNPAQGYTLDASGGIHAFGGAKQVPPGSGAYYDQAHGAAMDLVIVDWDEPSGYTLDCKGVVHPFGPGLTKPADAAYWQNAFVPPAPRT